MCMYPYIYTLQKVVLCTLELVLDQFYGIVRCLDFAFRGLRASVVFCRFWVRGGRDLVWACIRHHSDFWWSRRRCADAQG